MKNKTYICTTILLSYLVSPITAAQSLQQAVQRTIDENPKIQSAKAEKRAVTHEIRQAKAGYFPTVDLTLGAGWERTSNPTTRGNGDESLSLGRSEASLAARQMLFDGFATKNEVNRHSQRADSRAYTVFGQAEITALNAVEAYIDVMRREALVALAAENLVIHKKSSDQISLRSERGVGRQSDAHQATGRLALAKKNHFSEMGNLQDAKTSFVHLIGEFPDDLSSVNEIGTALPNTVEDAIEQGLKNHPILKSANADVLSAVSQHKTAKSAHMPRVDLEFGASHNTDLDGVEGMNEDAYAMIRLRYNLYNGGKDAARRKETAQLIEQAKEIRNNTHRQVVESMRLSWVAHQTVSSQMEFFKYHMDASIETNIAYQKQFDIGARTLLDLLDSANEMFVAKSAYTNAKYDKLYSQYRILTSKGELNSFLGIKLPEESKVETSTAH